MESNLDTSPENECRKQEEEEDSMGQQHQKTCQTDQSNSSLNSWSLINATAGSSRAKSPLEGTVNSSLSSKVIEYYQKYSQTTNLNQYFYLTPSVTTNCHAEDAKYYYNLYELNPKYGLGRQNCVGQDYGLNSRLPKERKRWERPPLIGQSSSNETSSYIKSMTDSQSPKKRDELQDQRDPEAQTSQQQETQTDTKPPIETEEKSTTPQTSPLPTIERKNTISPTSSVASYKPLEWDSGADVGYLYASSKRLNSGNTNKQLSTIERMALAHRLDPEGTNDSPGSIRTKALAAAVLPLTKGRPDANSTPLLGNASGSESEIEITPIVKSHVPGIIAGDESTIKETIITNSRADTIKDGKDVVETPKSANVFKLPLALKYSSEASKSQILVPPPEVPSTSKSNQETDSRQDNTSPLRKSSSMNLLAESPTLRQPLKRSQSELNLCGNEKSVPRLIFNSTSSIATVVNSKPTTSNKLIQTSLRVYTQESVGVQVSVLKEEEKPPLPTRATSLAPKSLNSILKNSKSTYKVQNPKSGTSIMDKSTLKEDEQREKELESSSDSSRNGSVTPQADDTENITGRANSFEYFPGHIYENVPNGSSSQVSSVDTSRTNSNSTMPNTSSSIDEKLWGGESDTMVRDLERCVNILKSLVDANKLDKQLKKRLIHHVVKRLVTAKYTDEKIERNLEENVPWNPADARNKVYRTEIIQALAKNTTDSSDDWKPTQKKKSPKKSAPLKEARPIINMPAEMDSVNSDKYDRNTDRTVMDGRKARMGLRADDCGRRSSSNTPTHKSESSECFLPQRGFNKNDKMKDIFITSISNSSPHNQNRALLDAVVNSRRSPIESSNGAGNSVDWRMSTNVSEHRYEMRRCSNSDSGDTKLVSYAEMEKRKQLIWITNEISHLSNLKKLLEQSKAKSERSNKGSPRKNKLSPSKSQKPKPYRLQNGDIEDEYLHRQWSSHCNLAACTSPITNSIKRMKKRNSCTQTATDRLAAYSRTGSEIISASIKSPNMKMTSVCVQTLRNLPSDQAASSQEHTGCLVHHPPPVTHCNYTDQICQCYGSKNSLHQFYSDTGKDDGQDEARYVSNESEDAKATKNQLNSNKMKCTCEAQNIVHGKSERSKKTAVASQTCDQCHCEGLACSCIRRKLVEPLYQCSRSCNYENNLTHSFEQLRVDDKGHPWKTLIDKNCANNCMCKKLDDVQSLKSECGYHSDKKFQPYFLENSSKASNSQECRCKSKLQDAPKIFISPTKPTRGNNTTNCRICGTTYQIDRKCACTFKNYPKPVAYELSFVNDDRRASNSELSSCGRIEVEIKSIDKNASPCSSARSQEKIKRSCTCGSEQKNVKRCDCNYREQQHQKLITEQKATLQDYLVTNNPRFADNVEIRRRYVSEIQQLRQLRKDRRIQLMAMATTTNIFTPPKLTSKATKCVQRKISDQEMKIRLRNRYQQLSEVRAKRKQKQLEEQARCNKLMAKIFCKKLQQKVLKGQVDLSQSVSVISNL